MLPLEYYQQPDVIALSRDLLGKFLLTKIDGKVSGGMIVETEAYRAPDDRASHAYNNSKTKRNEAMFDQGGTCYVYKCYGIHSLFNVVTNKEGIPHAILIRAIHPLIGVEGILRRRQQKKLDRNTAGGPGMLSQALGINMSHNGILLTQKTIWIESRNTPIAEGDIVASPRIGVHYAGEDAKRPWRFRIKDNPWTSPAKELIAK